MMHKGDSSAAIVLLREDGSTSILKRITKTTVPNHNVIQNGRTLIYNDSNRNATVATALDGNAVDRIVSIPGTPAFTRGLVQSGEHTFWVGSQMPAAVYQVDLSAGQVVTAFPLDGKRFEAVYAVGQLNAFRNLPYRMKLKADIGYQWSDFSRILLSVSANDWKRYPLPDFLFPLYYMLGPFSWLRRRYSF